MEHTDEITEAVEQCDTDVLREEFTDKVPVRSLFTVLIENDRMELAGMSMTKKQGQPMIKFHSRMWHLLRYSQIVQILNVPEPRKTRQFLSKFGGGQPDASFGRFARQGRAWGGGQPGRVAQYAKILADSSDIPEELFDALCPIAQSARRLGPGGPRQHRGEKKTSTA
eukprot:6592118-Pyramimonas_sp.AAC.2